MNTRNIAILGFLIMLFSVILPWPFGLTSISLLEFYFGFILAIFSGLGLFLGGMFTATSWRMLAMMAALVAYPIGVYFAYEFIKMRRPSIYQGIGGILAGCLWIAAVFVVIPAL